MAEDKKSFLMYVDAIHTIKLLSDEDAGKLLKHLFAYVSDENPVATNPMVALAFEPIKQSLKRDLAKYDGRKGTNSDSGKLGNLKRWNKDLYGLVEAEKMTLDEACSIAKDRKRDNKVATIADSVSVSVSDSVSDSDSDIKENKSAIASELLNFKASQFEIFWNTYDKKEGRKKCLAKFLKLKKEDVIKITENVLEYVKTTPNSQYRKNPYTWLNGEHWNDEIETIKNDNTTFTTSEKVLDFFNNTDLSNTIKKYKSSKEMIKVRLNEFLELEQMKPNFKNRKLDEVLTHFINHLQFNVPVIVTTIDPKVAQDWANRYDN